MTDDLAAVAQDKGFGVDALQGPAAGEHGPFKQAPAVGGGHETHGRHGDAGHTQPSQRIPAASARRPGRCGPAGLPVPRRCQGAFRSVPYCDIDLKPYEYDMAKAARILDEAGWKPGSDGIRRKDGKRMELGLLYNSNSVTEKTIAEYLQHEYGKLGIRVSLRGEEEQSYRDNMKNGLFDMIFNICWGMPYDPQSSMAAMRQRVYGDYAAQLSLPDKAQIDAAITEIMSSTDPVRRQELFTFALTHLHEDAIYIPLTYETNKALFTRRLKGVGFNQTQYEVPFTRMYFEGK